MKFDGLDFWRDFVGVVVIGRNEGKRLSACFSALSGFSGTLVYVDSGSSDDSLSIASKFGFMTLSLDPSRPFSAARARNEGFALVSKYKPRVKFIQFIDGDCVVAKDWLDVATRTLLEDPTCSAVIGHLREAYPTASVYNRLCEMEWKSLPGIVGNFGSYGGISMIRADVFVELGGFNLDVIAGEDSELGVRMGLAGYRIVKIDHLMATHDANIHKFAQWWKRSVRAGHAIGQRAHLNGGTSAKDCVRERRSTWFWGILLPISVLILLFPTNGQSVFLAGAYLVLAGRVYKYRRQQGECSADSALYSCFLVLAKIANGVGLAQFYWSHHIHQYRIIEYK
jgi:GT2 family glycosyltransferase